MTVGIVGACGSPKPVSSVASSLHATSTSRNTDSVPIKPQPPPAETAQAWFAAIDSKSPAAVASYSPPGSAVWDVSFPPSQWPTFTSVTCKTLTASAATAEVNCTFNESQAPAVGNPDSFWNLSMVRAANGRWLVASYGQG